MLLVWQIFEGVAMGLCVAALALALWAALNNNLKYALISVFLALVNGAVIVVARMAQAGGL